MKGKIAVLIADIVSSKKIKNREQTQKNLEKSLKNLKKKNGEIGLIANPEIMRGDEVEISFENASQCFKAFRKIESEIYPTKLRGGIGVGELDTELRKSVSEMDGPAFHRARKALENARVAKEESLLFVKFDDEKLEEILNSLLILLYSVKNDWTKREHEFTEYYLQNEEKPTHREIGNYFGVSRSTVSRTLSKAHLSAVEKAQNTILKMLSEICGV